MGERRSGRASSSRGWSQRRRRSVGGPLVLDRGRGDAGIERGHPPSANGRPPGRSIAAPHGCGGCVGGQRACVDVGVSIWHGTSGWGAGNRRHYTGGGRVLSTRPSVTTRTEFGSGRPGLRGPGGVEAVGVQSVPSYLSAAAGAYFWSPETSFRKRVRGPTGTTGPAHHRVPRPGRAHRPEWNRPPLQRGHGGGPFVAHSNMNRACSGLGDDIGSVRYRRTGHGSTPVGFQVSPLAASVDLQEGDLSAAPRREGQQRGPNR